MDDFIKQFEEKIKNKPKGAAYFLRKKFDADLDNKVAEKVVEESEKIIEKIKVFSKDDKKNNLLAKEQTGKHEKMVLNYLFLIHQYKTNAFISYVN